MKDKILTDLTLEKMEELFQKASNKVYSNSSRNATLGALLQKGKQQGDYGPLIVH